jgi:type VI protein secretion system component VasK
MNQQVKEGRKRMNKKLTWLCVAAVIGGISLALWQYGGSVLDFVTGKSLTAEIAGDIKETAKNAVARAAAQDEKTRTEVRYVYEQTRTRINALPADSVADGLNSELAIFRGMAPGSGGLDGD